MSKARFACAWLLAAVLLVGLAACAGDDAATRASDGPQPTVALGSAPATGAPRPTEASASLPAADLPPDLCTGPPALVFDVTAAGQAPVLPAIDPSTPPVLGLLGQAGAGELATALAPADTFCSLPVSQPAALVISQAMGLVTQGQSAEARALLAQWLAGREGRAAKLAKPAPAGDTARQTIRDLLNAAAADQAAGGDGADLSSRANQAFRDLFAAEIGDAGFGDSLRLAEEAFLLGETELGETASNRARRIWEEKLQADLEDFNPCTATREDVRDLLNSLAQAMLLGVPGSFEDDGQYYQAVKQKAQAAAQQMFNEAAAKAGLGSLASPVPECTPGGEFEVRQTLPFAEEPCVNRIPFALTWQGDQARLEGNGPAECSHVEENLGGSQVAIHQIQDLTLSFSGTATKGSPGSLQVTLSVSGELIEFYSNFPPESPQVFTEANPFRVPAEGTFPLTFEFREGATAEIRGGGEGAEVFVLVLHLHTNR